MAFSLILVAIEFLDQRELGTYFVPHRISVFNEGSLSKLYYISYVDYLVEFPLLGWLFGYLLTRKLGHK